MARNLNKIEAGTANIEDFAYWINERHSIYVKRFEQNLPKPWTEDEIFLRYKFTNAFRQLDKGTIALRNMLRGQIDPPLIFFNIVWYRLFNWYEHAENLGFVTEFDQLEEYIQKRFRTHKKIFTGAHMTTGVAFESKHTSYLRAAKEAWDKRHYFSQIILGQKRMEDTFNLLLELYMVGRFVAYELTCDFRFTKFLDDATDKLTWANMGPGAMRGLKRLGMPYKKQADGEESMQQLYKELPNYLSANVLRHYWDRRYEDIVYILPPFELREVEHSLCEFDKYQRVLLGQGRPRGRYNGKAETD